MRWFIVSALLICCSSQASAAIKSCEELKDEIATKIDARGVTSYRLTIVRNEEAENGTAVDGKIIGTCEGGTKKIIYTRSRMPDAAGE